MRDIYTRQARLLLRVLAEFEHTDAGGNALFALKGGTALNFFVQPFPRLSVDIDLAYCPLNARDAALSAIADGLRRLDARLKSRLPGVECTYVPSAGGSKLLVRHEGATVKVEPNSVIRGTVFDTALRELHPAAQDAFVMAVTTRCLDEADLYGGKLCAALDRQHPRDLFDLLPLMRTKELPDKTRKAFLVYALSHPRPLAELLNPNPQPLAQVFQKEFEGMTREPVALETLEEARAWLGRTVRTVLTEKERRFLISCKEGTPDWTLPDLPEHIPTLPAVRWKLHNIAQLEKQPEKHKAALEKLRAVLKL